MPIIRSHTFALLPACIERPHHFLRQLPLLQIQEVRFQMMHRTGPNNDSIPMPTLQLRVMHQPPQSTLRFGQFKPARHISKPLLRAEVSFVPVPLPKSPPLERIRIEPRAGFYLGRIAMVAVC
jgi:hypothetical protein